MHPTHEQSWPRTLLCLLLRFQRRTVSSQLPDATFAPSGEKATEVIWRLETPRTSDSPVARFHSLMATSESAASAAAMNSPLGEMAIAFGPPHGPFRMRVCPFCKFHTRMTPSRSPLPQARRVPPGEKERDGERLPTSPNSSGSLD